MDKEIFKKMILNSSTPFAKIIKGVEEKYKFIEANEAFCSLINKSEEEIINKYIYELESFRAIGTLKTDYEKISEKKYTMCENLDFNNIPYKLEVIIGSDNDIVLFFIKGSYSKYKFDEVLRKSPLNFYIKDLQGRYLDVNDNFTNSVNKDYTEIIGKNHCDIWSEERVKEIVEQETEVLNTNQFVVFHEKIPIDKDTGKIFETAKWPCVDNGEVVGIIGVSLKISDRLKIKELIERTEKNLLDLANNIDELIIIRDEHKALYVSPYFERLFGFKPDSLYEDMNNLYTYWDKVEFTSEPLTFQHRGIDVNLCKVVKEGCRDLWIRTKFIPIYDDYGNIVRKIGFIEDITKDKTLDEKLEELRMDFFANVSHELRTPINLIMTSMQLIELKLSNEGKELIDNYNKIINRNSYRLLRLVNNLIDITRIKSGHFHYSPENRDIVSFVEDVVLSLVALVEQKGMSIIFDTDVEEKVIAFDLNHMERILYNLISNGIKFNKEKGKVEVKISTKDNIKISIRDTGVGIVENEVKKVFNSIKKENKRLRREGEGSGMGLSLVKSLVELNKGTITVNSQLGVGTEFVIMLPNEKVEEGLSKGPNYNYSVNHTNRFKIEFSDVFDM